MYENLRESPECRYLEIMNLYLDSVTNVSQIVISFLEKFYESSITKKRFSEISQGIPKIGMHPTDTDRYKQRIEQGQKCGSRRDLYVKADKKQSIHIYYKQTREWQSRFFF